MTPRVPDHELAIDECNSALLHILTEYANNKEPIQLARLTSCYSGDTMGATTVGQRFGFMDMSEDVTTLVDRVENWRSRAIVQGTIFRFHPWLSTIVKKIMSSNVTESDRAVVSLIVQQQRILPPLLKSDAKPESSSPKSPQSTVWNALRPIFEGFVDDKTDMVNELSHCAVALMLVESDPIARHILFTLHYLSRNEEAVEELRCELESLITPLSTPPTLRELKDRKSDLPFLHAVLLEGLRLEELSDGMGFPGSPYATDNASVLGGCRIPVEGAQLHTAAANMDFVLGDAADLSMPDGQVAPVTNQVSAFGDTISLGFEDNHQALVAKIIVQIVQHFDLKLINPTVSRSTTDMAHAKAQFSIVPNLAEQLVDAGIHPTSPMAAHIGRLRRHMGSRFMTIMIKARASEETAAVPVYAKLHGVQSLPILDKKERRALHEAIRAVSKGVLGSMTDSSDNCVVVKPRHGREKGARDSYNRRSNDQNDKSDHQHGYTAEHSLSSETDIALTSNAISDSTLPSLLGTRESRISPTAGVLPRTEVTLAGWNNFSSHVAERDRVNNEAASRRIEDMVAEQTAQGIKGVSTFKQTRVINGKRTLVDTFKDGKSINDGGVALPPPEPEQTRTPRVLPDGYIPPHKRVKAATRDDVKVVVMNKKNGENREGFDAYRDIRKGDGGVELKNEEKYQGDKKKADEHTMDQEAKIDGLMADLDITTANHGDEAESSHGSDYRTLGEGLADLVAATE